MLNELNAALHNAAALCGVAKPSATFNPTKPEHVGDFTTAIALQCAKGIGLTQMALAEKLAEVLDGFDMFASVTITKPGFLNVTLRPETVQKFLGSVCDAGAQYGTELPNGHKVLLEYVSANPTGPLHIGHARQAVLGDALAAVLTARGFEVQKEYYYNDSGNQIDRLVQSVWLRAMEHKGSVLWFERDYPEDAGATAPSGHLVFPREGYHGGYVAEIALKYLESTDGELGDMHETPGIKLFAVDLLRAEQQKDLALLGTCFESLALESDLHSNGAVQAVIDTWDKNGQIYHHDGALWFKSTSYGDNKDRVVKKKTGEVTYFVPDVAYHQQKLNRGFTTAINVQGVDHHGTTARVRGGVQGLNMNAPQDYPTYVLHRMLKVMQNGVELKASKRAGGYITLNDLVNLIGKDALRYGLAAGNPESEITVDVDVLTAQAMENPVYYAQYAHARLCSLLDKIGHTGALPDPSVFALPPVHKLVVLLMQYPGTLDEIVKNKNPNTLVTFVREMSSMVQALYQQSPRVIHMDDSSKNAYKLVFGAAKQTLGNSLTLLAIHAPERMPGFDSDEDQIENSEHNAGTSL